MTVSVNGTTGITFNDASTQNTAATGFGFKNRIINGQMVLDQRNAGASGTNNNTYIVDRWAYYGNQTSKGTWGQNLNSVTPPTGFRNYLGFQSSSAYSVLSGDEFEFYQRIEGFNISDLAWGTANAATVTLSFWVRSSLTGTFGGSLRNASANRSYPFSYTISVANTWEQKSITIAGDTTGTWATDNSTGVTVNLSLGAGSTLSGTAGAWAGSNFTSATGATSVVGTSGATFYITGVQLEKGSTATSFDYRPYGTELALCQRYFEKSYDANVAIGTATANGRTMIITGTATNNAIARSIDFCVEKRTAPTMTTWDANGNSGRITTFDAGTAATENVTPSVPFGEISTKAARIGNAGTSRSGFAFSWAASSEL